MRLRREEDLRGGRRSGRQPRVSGDLGEAGYWSVLREIGVED